MEEIKILIPGNKVAEYFYVNPEIQHEDMYFFPLEKDVIKEMGLDIKDWKIKEYIPGLRMRGSGKIPTVIESTLDGYELILKRK
jgi:hypothetical protein